MEKSEFHIKIIMFLIREGLDTRKRIIYYDQVLLVDIIK